MRWYKLIIFIVIVHILANYTYEEKQIHVIRLVCECSRGLNSPFRITENVEILNIICCRQKSEILSTVVLLKNLKIYLLKLFINKSQHFYLVKCVY